MPGALRAFHLTNPDYWLHPVSSTFHGRDIFTPVAAHLSLGVAPESLGEPARELTWLPLPQPRVTAEGIGGEIIYCDVYGNLISNIPATLLEGGRLAKYASGAVSSNAFPAPSTTPGSRSATTGTWSPVRQPRLPAKSPFPTAALPAVLSAGPGEPVTVTLIIAG